MFDIAPRGHWKPHARQELAISVPDTVLEVFYGGAAGGGKTDVGICMPLVKKCRYSDRLWYQHPKFKGLVLRRTIPEIKKELMKRCGDYYPQTGAKPNYSDHVWKWPWGAELWLAGCEHEEDVRRFDTEQFNYIFFEELTSFTEFIYMFMFSRCRAADEDLPPLVFGASNPGNVGHGWVRKRFVEPYKDGGKIIKQYFFNRDGSYVTNDDGTRKFIQRIYIPAKGTDNPYLLKNDPDYLTRLELLPEAEKASKLYGDWWTFSGQVFDTFRSKKFPDEPDNALHVIPEFIIPQWWPRVLAIDWGYKAATVAYWAAISPEGRIYIYREYYARQTDIAIWATEIGEQSRGENIRCMVLDTNAWDTRGEEKTIAAQFQEKFDAAFGPGLVVEQASKARISGKILIQECLRWRPKPVFENNHGYTFDSEEAERLKRISESTWLKYIELFKPPDTEKNLPRLQIFESCTNLITVIPLCVYDDKKIEDVKEWQATDESPGDDPYDTLRYLLKRVDKYIKEAYSEFLHREREQVIVQRFNETNDVTGYYRRMEKLERDGRQHFVHGSIKRPNIFQKSIRASRMRRMYST